MAFVVYVLCALTALACASLLLGWRRSGSRMLLWSGVCFALLTLANVVVVFDYYVLPGVPLWPVRHGLGLLAVSVLLFGLVFEER